MIEGVLSEMPTALGERLNGELPFSSFPVPTGTLERVATL